MPFTRYAFFLDVYKPEKYYDESGQAVETWTFDRTIKCNYMPSRGEERMVGRINNPHSYLVWTSDTDVDYSDQLRNLRDRYNNIIEDAQFNVIGVKRFGGWSKVRHSELNIQAVLD